MLPQGLPQKWWVLETYQNMLWYISGRYISDGFKLNPTNILKGTIIAIYEIPVKVAGKS